MNKFRTVRSAAKLSFAHPKLAHPKQPAKVALSIVVETREKCSVARLLIGWAVPIHRFDTGI